MSASFIDYRGSLPQVARRVRQMVKERSQRGDGGYWSSGITLCPGRARLESHFNLVATANVFEMRTPNQSLDPLLFLGIPSHHHWQIFRKARWLLLTILIQASIQLESRADECHVGKSLRKISQMLAGGAELLRVKAQMIGIS